MILRQASLNRRLVAGAAVFITLALIVAGIAIDFALHRFIQGQIDQRLDTQIVFLSSTLTTEKDGVIAVAGNADGPPFDGQHMAGIGKSSGEKIFCVRTRLRAPALRCRSSIVRRARSVQRPPKGLALETNPALQDTTGTVEQTAVTIIAPPRKRPCVVRCLKR